MDSIGSIVAKELKVSRRIETWADYPNAVAIHPTVATYNSHDDNVIVIVDLAQQHFQIRDRALLDSFWWLSFTSYCAECRHIFQGHLTSDGDDVDAENAGVCSVILQFLSGDATKLCSDHQIADLFVEDCFATDSLIALRTPSPRPTFDFMSFSADNPYAKMGGLQISGDGDGDAAASKDEDTRNRLEMLRVDGDGHSLWKWFEVAMPSMSSPTTTSLEAPGTICNDMLRHWECRLSAEGRYLVVWPQKLGEVSDVRLSENKLFWVQSLFGSEKRPSRRRLFAFNECDLSRRFETQCLKLLVSTEQPARFRILPLRKRSSLIWNFSVNGAVADLFAAVGPDTPEPLRNRLFRVDNAQNFKNYRFKDGGLKDLIRDVPKLCALKGGGVVFGGACFVSVLRDLDRVRVYEATESGDGPQLITGEVPGAFYFASRLDVEICAPRDTARWITDYVPFRDDSVLARWPGDGGRSVFGIWRFDRESRKWQSTRSEPYDDVEWNSAIFGCYHFAERTKTLLLAIRLQRDW